MEAVGNAALCAVSLPYVQSIEACTSSCPSLPQLNSKTQRVIEDQPCPQPRSSTLGVLARFRGCESRAKQHEIHQRSTRALMPNFSIYAVLRIVKLVVCRRTSAHQYSMPQACQHIRGTVEHVASQGRLVCMMQPSKTYRSHRAETLRLSTQSPLASNVWPVFTYMLSFSCM